MKLNRDFDMPAEQVVEKLLEALHQLSALSLASEKFMRSMYQDHVAGKKELSKESQDLAVEWGNQTMKSCQFMVKFVDQAGVKK